MTDFYGLAAGQARGSSSVDVITHVETTSNGDVLIHTGNLTIYRSGDISRPSGEATIRLNPADRDRLIDALVFARTATTEGSRS